MPGGGGGGGGGGGYLCRPPLEVVMRNRPETQSVIFSCNSGQNKPSLSTYQTANIYLVCNSNQLLD